MSAHETLIATETPPTEQDPRWHAVVARDATADGAFYYSVSTTGVYCRPSCAARLARPEHVRFHATRAAAEAAGFRPCKRCKPERDRSERHDASTHSQIAAIGPTMTSRLHSYDWTSVHGDLDAHGWALLNGLLSAEECRAIAGLYDGHAAFRSHVVMERHGFGRGEYKYFAYPLPEIVTDLRTTLYPRLAPIADRWNEALGLDARYPAVHAQFLERCHSAGQRRPTPLLLRYGVDDFNALHQDLYGAHVFPFQVVFLLSQPGTDFTGGEFVLTEQRPRMQSRAEVIPLRQGDAAIFAVHNRPVQGARGYYRVNLRHGVSRLRSGHRHTMGIIFHDAN
jgi:hypothetical protein